MSSPRRTTQSLPLRSMPPHVRAAAAVRSGPSMAPEERSKLRQYATSGGLVAFAILFGVAARWMLYGDAFRVQDVHISELQAVDPIAVSEAAKVTGRTLFTVDRGQVEAAVASIPGVVSVSVTRDWPHAVNIDIVEAQGWGYWDVGGRRMVVDAGGAVIEHGRVPQTQAMVIYELPLTPEQALEAQPDPETIKLVQRLLDGGTFSVLRVTPTGFTFRRDRGLTVHTANGPAAVFGDAQDFEFKVATWGSLLDKIEQQRLAVNEIDLRFGKHVVMR